MEDVLQFSARPRPKVPFFVKSTEESKTDSFLQYELLSSHLTGNMCLMLSDPGSRSLIVVPAHC